MQVCRNFMTIHHKSFQAISRKTEYVNLKVALEEKPTNLHAKSVIAFACYLAVCKAE